MEAYLVEWANLLVRWLHLIAGIAWIGASFHFIGLDLTLETPKEERDRAKGVMGEQWAVHGGGFFITSRNTCLLRQSGRSKQVFLLVIEAAAVHRPLLAHHALGAIALLLRGLEREIESDEVERRADPRDAREGSQRTSRFAHSTR